ncbi:MAG: hypothetical protein CM15mP3_00500 [Candidatus Poseidoniales archaeon]|nr:MAG: hypothetical protein CM15mP3_00500 [Candidatus Poseidoniales archaeon]
MDSFSVAGLDFQLVKAGSVFLEKTKAVGFMQVRDLNTK